MFAWRRRLYVLEAAKSVASTVGRMKRNMLLLAAATSELRISLLFGSVRANPSSSLSGAARTLRALLERVYATLPLMSNSVEGFATNSSMLNKNSLNSIRSRRTMLRRRSRRDSRRR